MEYDLVTLSSLLGEKPRYKRLVGLISKCRDLGSICLDLVSAADNLVALQKVTRREVERYPGSPDPVDTVVGQALFANALIAYARVHNSHKGRAGFAPAPLDERQKAAHERLMSLRNQGIAHYEPGRREDVAPWVNDRLICTLAGAAPKFDHVYSRYNYKAEDALDLAELLGLAAREADRRRLVAERELGSELSSLAGETKVREALEQAVFDAVAFHGSKDDVEAIARDGRVNKFLPAVVSGG